MEWNPYSTIFFKNLFQLLGFVEFLLLTTGIRGCLFRGYTCILKRKQKYLLAVSTISYSSQLNQSEIMKEVAGIECCSECFGKDSNTFLLFHIRLADAGGKAHASSLFPTFHIKGMHWAWCKFLHNASFIIKRVIIVPVFHLTHMCAKAHPRSCLRDETEVPKRSLLTPTAQLYTPSSCNAAFCSRAKQLMALEAYIIPCWSWLTNNLLIERVQHLSSYKSPSVD